MLTFDQCFLLSSLEHNGDSDRWDCGPHKGVGCLKGRRLSFLPREEGMVRLRKNSFELDRFFLRQTMPSSLGYFCISDCRLTQPSCRNTLSSSSTIKYWKRSSWKWRCCYSPPLLVKQHSGERENNVSSCSPLKNQELILHLGRQAPSWSRKFRPREELHCHSIMIILWQCTSSLGLASPTSSTRSLNLSLGSDNSFFL